MVIDVKCCDGVKNRHLLITSQEIEEKEILGYDYGQHPVKKMAYFEMREEEMKNYFKNKSPNELLEILTPINVEEIQMNGIFDLFSQITKVNYILKTPSAFLFLLLENFIEISTLNLLFQQKIKNTKTKTWEIFFFEDVEKLWKKFESMNDPIQVDSKKDKIRNSLGKITILEMSKLIHHLLEN